MNRVVTGPRATWLGAALVRLEVLAGTWTSSDFNVFAHSARFATVSFMLALLSGGYIFLFYNVAEPYGSTVGLGENPLGLLMRGFHRYASRAFLLFAVIHAARLAITVRFRGPRWLAWQTGIAMVLVAWFVGVTGYLLNWDQQSYVLTLGLVKLLDAAGIFVQPFALSFLTSDTLRENLFFITLYVHLSVPVAATVILLVHVSRLRRPQYLPARAPITVLVLLLAVISLLAPATSAAPVDLSQQPLNAPLDPWYSFGTMPALIWTPPAFAGLGALSAAVLLSAPFIGKRRPGSAVVDPDKCDECNLCVIDCPYGAITMTPLAKLGLPARGKVENVAVVNADRCVGCGICIGSCTFGGITLGSLSLDSMKETAAERLAQSPGTLLITCRQPAPVALPAGVQILEVPCVGDINRNVLSNALGRGATGVLVAGCPTESCRFREGAAWAKERSRKERKPGWLPRVIANSRIVQVAPGDTRSLFSELRRFQEDVTSGTVSAEPESSRTGYRVAAAVLLPLLLFGAVGFDIPAFRNPASDGLLKVALRVDSPFVEERTQSAEQQAERLPHMRSDSIVISRERVPLLLTVTLDGRTVTDDVLKARGFRQDGLTYAYRELRLPPGQHRLSARLSSTVAGIPYDQAWEGTVTVNPNGVAVLAYDILGDGFVVK